MIDNIYVLLGVKNFASKDEIEKSYRKLALKHHPDRGGDTEKMKIVNRAYEILTKDRERYDNWLRQKLQPSQRVVIIVNNWNWDTSTMATTSTTGAWT